MDKHMSQVIENRVENVCRRERVKPAAIVLRAERHGWKVIEWGAGVVMMWHHRAPWGIRVLFGDSVVGDAVEADRV